MRIIYHFNKGGIMEKEKINLSMLLDIAMPFLKPKEIAIAKALLPVLSRIISINPDVKLTDMLALLPFIRKKRGRKPKKQEDESFFTNRLSAFKVILNEKEHIEEDELEGIDFTEMDTKYFTEKNIRSAPVDFMLPPNVSPRDITWHDNHFEKEKNGYFAIAVVDGKAIRCGHAGHCRTTCVKEYVNDIREVDAVLIVRTNFEGNPRGVLGRSNVVEVR